METGRGSGCSSDIGEACGDSTQMKVPYYPLSSLLCPLAPANPEGTAKGHAGKGKSHINFGSYDAQEPLKSHGQNLGVPVGKSEIEAPWKRRHRLTKEPGEENQRGHGFLESGSAPQSLGLNWRVCEIRTEPSQ